MSGRTVQREYGPNDWLVDEIYERYRGDPSSVSEIWRDFFDGYQRARDTDFHPGTRSEDKAREAPAADQAANPSEPKERAPAQDRPGSEEAQILKGSAAVIARNMAASREVPTATSVRVVPAKLLEVSTDLDAALLLLPLLGLEPPDSPRVRGTIDVIAQQLSAGGPLIYRYPPGQDNLAGTEGAFLPCSFWLVQALAHTGRATEAHELFGQLCALASPIGLYAEEIDPTTNRHLGNYPQALTHAALLQAALSLRDV